MDLRGLFPLTLIACALILLGATATAAPMNGTIRQGQVHQGKVGQGVVRQGTVRQGPRTQGPRNQGPVRQGTQGIEAVTSFQIPGVTVINGQLHQK